MHNDPERFKLFLVQTYFPDFPVHEPDKISLVLNKKERKILKVLWFPKRFYVTYFLVARSDNFTSKIKIIHKKKGGEVLYKYDKQRKKLMP